MMNNSNVILSHDEIAELLEAVKADREARQVFLAMERDDQLLSMLGMIAYSNSQVANLQKDLIQYRNQRETEEKKRGDFLMDTGTRIAQGIKKELEARDPVKWFVDRVLPQIITIITLAILYFVFGGKVPTP